MATKAKKKAGNICAKRFTNTMKEAGIDYVELADMLEVTPSTVGNWSERGVPAAMSFAVGRILSVNPEWLCVEACEIQDVDPASFRREHLKLLNQLSTAELKGLLAVVRAAQSV